MRGNHRYLGRQDYTEPTAMSDADRGRVASVTITQATNKKTWFAVNLGGYVVGYVTSRLGGQNYRTLDMKDWKFVASDWSRSDPPHGLAVLAFLMT